MKVGDSDFVAGYITKDKFVAGRTLQELEAILGFQRGRFGKGIYVLALDRLPLPGEFQLASYSMIAEHRFQMPSGLDIDKLTKIASESFALDGPERLIKIRAVEAHDPSLDPDVQYPPGKGAPQWKLTVRIQATCVAVVTDYPNGTYRL